MKLQFHLTKLGEKIKPTYNWFNRITLLKSFIGIILLLFLVAFPFFDHSSGIAAVDVSENRSAIFPGARPSMPFDLSGYIEVPYAAALNPNGGHITIEAWVKRNEVDRSETILGNGWKTSYWLGFSSVGKVRFTPNGQPRLEDSTSVIEPGEWRHIAVTYDGTTRQYYIDGMLDKSSSVKTGDISASSPGQYLGIGFDRDDTFSPNYYGGLIDNLRVWSRVRTADEIKNNMYTTFGSPYQDLIAEWSFNGNANDPAGGNHGTLQGQAAFSPDSALPHDIFIPQVKNSPSLDGFCDPSVEYADALQVSVSHTVVWLMHTSSDLWVCFDGLTENTFHTRVFLDPEYTRLDPSREEHLFLEVLNDGTKLAALGTADGFYQFTNSFDGQWDAAYLACCGEFPTYRAEYQINKDLVQGNGNIFGLALRRVLLNQPINDIWPAYSKFSQPSTWSTAHFGSFFDAKYLHIPLIIR